MVRNCLRDSIYFQVKVYGVNGPFRFAVGFSNPVDIAGKSFVSYTICNLYFDLLGFFQEVVDAKAIASMMTEMIVNSVLQGMAVEKPYEIRFADCDCEEDCCCTEIVELDCPKYPFYAELSMTPEFLKEYGK